MLSKKQLLNVYFFIFLSFIAMFLETLGIGLIIPFLQTLISDDTNKYLTNAGFNLSEKRYSSLEGVPENLRGHHNQIWVK